MRKILKRLPDDALRSFIVTDKESSVVLVKIDDLCEFLIKTHGRSFSVSQFEKRLNAEINEKLIGKPMTEKNIKALCRYIDELSIFLSDVNNKVTEGNLPKDTRKEFFERNRSRYEQILERARDRSPEEYAVLKERFDKRFESK